MLKANIIMKEKKGGKKKVHLNAMKVYFPYRPKTPSPQYYIFVVLCYGLNYTTM